MNENQNNIDSLFRNTLKTYREEPPVDVKGNIHKKLDASYMKKGFFTGKNLFLSVFIIAFCTAGASIFFICAINDSSASKVYAKEIIYPNHKNIERNIDDANLQIAQNNISNNAIAENHNNPADQKILSQNSNTQNQNNFNKLISQNKEGNGNVGKINSATNSSTEKYSSVKNNQQNKTNTTAENKQQSKINPVADNNSTSKTNSSANNNQQNKTNTSSENNQQIADNNQQSTNNSQQGNTVNADNKITDNNSATNSSGNTNPTNNTEKTVPNQTNPDNSSAKTGPNTNPDNAKLSSSNANDQSETTNIVNAGKGEKKLKESKLSVDAFVSPSFIMSSEAKTIPSDYGSVNKKSMISYNWGIEAKYDLNSNFFLQTGVNYSVYKDKINYDVKFLTSLDTTESHWTYPTHTIAIDSTYQDSVGGIWIHDTIYHTITDTSWLHKADSTFYKNNGKTVNTISYVEFPFLIGYTFIKYNLTFRITTGISYGILRGTSWKPDIPLISSNSTQILGEVWKKNIYNYILRVGCFYSLNNKLSVFAQPSLKLNLNSLFDKEFTMAKKYQMLGLNIGLNYKL